MPTEFAFLTAKQITGTARWLDFWNADLFMGESGINACYQGNKMQVRTNLYSWLNKVPVGSENGVVQAIFEMPSAGYFLGIVRLSSDGAWVNIKLDDRGMGYFLVPKTGFDIPVVANLSKGTHALTVIQRKPPPMMRSKPLWFHSVTCFTV